MLPIVTAPRDVLSKMAEPVKKVDATIAGIIEEMKKTLAATHDPEGVGLAAPQVGKSLRIFIAKPTPKSPVMVCINPVIIEKSPELSKIKRPKNTKYKGPKKLEGCLSLPGIWGTVLRSPLLTFEYLDEYGKKHTRLCKDFIATIVQHETDHLNGILFPKRVLEQKGKLYKSHKNEEGEEEFDELNI